MDTRSFDALIITALFDELEAVLAFGEGGKGAWATERDPNGFPFHFREFPREDGSGPLRIAAASFDEMGESVTAARATALINYLGPACLAMCGICAGKKKDVFLGDVIVADRVYSYDHGKLIAKRDEDGRRSEEFYHDIKTFNLKDTWRVDAAYFARELGWTAELLKTRPLSLEVQQRWLLRALLAHEQESATAPDEHPDRDTRCPAFDSLWDRLRLPQNGLLVETPGVLALTEKGRGLAVELKRKYRKELPKDREFKIHVGAIATGKVVQKDPELFDRLEKLVRKTLGAEMEAAAIGLIGEQLNRRAIIVKAVSDYGDGDKDDAFRTFAARASAEVLIRFLLRNLEPTKPEIDDRDFDRRAFSPMSLFRGDAPLSDNLLSRIERIADLRVQASGATAQFHRAPARAPFGSYLEVTRTQGPFANVFPVAAVDHVTSEVLDAFLADIDASYRRADPGVCSTLVYAGASPSPEVRAKANERRVLLQSFTEYQGLIDFRDYLDRQILWLERDPIYPPDLYIEQRAVLHSDGGTESKTDDALDVLSKMLASPLGRFVLVLGDFGTGKTFLLHELARRMALERGPLVPVLIELRALEKAPKLDALIAQHLSVAGMDRLDLPAFRYMLAEGRIALLFDGFDELALRVNYERAIEHFSTLIEAAQGEAKVVITSRSQHFLSDQQAKLVLAEQASSVKGYRLAKLQAFSKEQIQRFLERRLGAKDKAEARFRLLDEVQDLLGLAHNPRMLGFIADIPEKELLEAKERNKAITSAGLYELLLNRWLVNEFQRAHPKGALPGLDVTQRWKAVTDLAMRLWQRTERSINILELPQEMVGAVQALATHDLDPGVVRHQIGSGTLLVRDEERNFSFIHQSVMEWLVAKAVAQELKQEGAAALRVREISPLMADFVWGLAGREEAERWAQRALAEETGDVILKNALRILERLGVQARVGLKLSGQDLRGAELSGKNLRHADLTDAILTGASLVGADLTGAKLMRAKLQRADLSNAKLEEADLRDADMFGAKLLGANVARARLAGASLRAAKLVRAQFDPSALEGCDLFGAAHTEPGPAQPMVSVISDCFSVACSPDGRLLASGHYGLIRLWDLETGIERLLLKGHGGIVWSLAFTADGKTLASGSWDKTIRLWNVGKGTERLVIKGHSKGIRSVAFAPDGKTLASGADDATVRLWTVDTGAERRVFEGHSKGVWSVAFTASGKTLASGGEDTTVRLWNVSTGTQRRILEGHSEGVWSIAFTVDGKTLASGSNDQTVRLWNVRTGAERRVLNGHSKGVLSVAFTSDSKTLASGSWDKTVRLWDLKTGTTRHILQGHGGGPLSLAFTADGKTLASGADDNTVRLWDVVSGAERRVLQGHVESIRSVAFSPDGNTLVSGSWDNTLRLWDMRMGAERRILQGHSKGVLSVAFTTDGKTLASGSWDNTVRLWDTRTGAEPLVLQGHYNGIRSVAFSPDGKTLASGAADKTVRLWDVATGVTRLVIEGHSRSIWSVAFSPDGNTLASAWDNRVRLWDTRTGAERRVLEGHTEGVRSVAFAPDGNTLASGSRDNTVHLWDTHTGAKRRVLHGHAESIRSVTFSPDNNTLASGSWDNTVRLWDTRTGVERRVLEGHSEGVSSVAFTADGKTLASASSDGTVRIWSVETGKCLVVLVSLPEGWVAFTPDGRYRFAGNLGGAFWHVIGLCRFEPGELDPYLPVPLRVPDDEPLYQSPQ